MNLKNKKILTLTTSVVALATPVTTVVSCQVKQSSAASNQINSLLTGNNIKLLARQKLFRSIIDTEYKRLHTKYSKSSVKSEKDKAKYYTPAKQAQIEEEAWNIFALSKLKDDSNYWVNQVTTLVSNGTINKPDWTKENWIPSFQSVGVVAGKTIKPGYYPSYKVAKEIIKKHPTLGWDLEITKLMMSELLFTTVVEPELYTIKEAKDNKKTSIGGKWFKKVEDLPAYLLRKNKTLRATGTVVDYTPENFFLNKFLKEKKPTLVWTKTTKERAIAGSNAELKDANSFNEINPRQADLLAPKKIFSNDIMEFSGITAKNKAILEDLEGFEGFGTPAVTDKGDSNLTILGLKQRLKDNSSKSGFIDDEGIIHDNWTQAGKAGKTIIKDGTVTAQFVQQFLPHFIAPDSRSLKISSEDGMEWVFDTKTNGTGSLSKQKAKFKITQSNGKKIVEFQKFEEEKYNDKKRYVHLDRKKKFQDNIYKDQYPQFVIKDGKVESFTLGDEQQLITQKEELSHVVGGNEEAWFYADSKLLEDKDKLRKLIFLFASSDASIVSEAQKFMVKVRGYELKVNNPKTKEALKGSGLWKEE